MHRRPLTKLITLRHVALFTLFFGTIACENEGKAPEDPDDTTAETDGSDTNGVGGAGTGAGDGDGDRDPDPDTCPPGSSGSACALCGVGTFCPGDGAPEEACAAGTFDDDLDSATPCIDWSRCAAGTSAVDGTVTEDRLCTKCEKGSFSATDNAADCLPFSECAAGTWIKEEGSRTEDQVCSSCSSGTYSSSKDASVCTPYTNCEPGTFVKTEGSRTSDQVCEACADDLQSTTENASHCFAPDACPAGTIQLTAATDSSPAVCDACSDGQHCPGGELPATDCGNSAWDHDSDPATACAPRTLCLAGEMVDQEGDATSDRSCSSCAAGTYSLSENAGSCLAHSTCEAGTFVSTEGTASNDRSCNGCAGGRFSTSDNASSCSAWTECLAGQSVASTGSAASDRVCQTCEEGSFSAGNNASSCEPLSDCAPGEEVAIDGDLDHDRSCTACTVGTYSDEMNAAECLAWSNCDAGTRVTSAPSSSADRECVACDSGTYSNQPNLEVCTALGECPPGTIQTQAGTPSSLPECSACPTGSYCAGDTTEREDCESGTWDHDGNSATPCTAWVDCSAGQYEVAIGNATTNRSCASCGASEFSTETNVSSCSGMTTCEPGEMILSAGTKTNDRTCRACEEGEFSSEANATACLPHLVCAAGSFELRVGTNIDDRVCQACEPGRFSNDDNAPACEEWSTCSPGSFVDNTPSFQEDRSCQTCGFGTYSDQDNLSSCLAADACSAGTVQIAAATATSSAVCAECAVGGYCAGAAAPELACASGTWDHDENPATACAAHTNCLAGQGLAQAGTTTTNRSCTDCALGTFSTTNNSTCSAFTTCSAGTYISSTGSRLADQVCSPCAAETISFVDNATSCEAVVPTQIASGANHTCVLRNDGSVRCYGYNNYGQLGYGNVNNIGDNETPASAGSVSLGAKAVQLTAGTWHSCALLETGRIRCWGHGGYGQLGMSNTNAIGDNELPGAIPAVSLGGKLAIQVAAGGYHTCALIEGGSVMCWGRGLNGRLGNGNTSSIGDNEYVSATVSLSEPATQLALGLEHSCALLASGAVTCWGRSNYGQLGYGNFNDIGDNETPASVGTVSLGGSVSSLTAGATHNCALMSDETVKCWGRSNYGQLGYGNTNNIGDNETPASVAGVNIGGSAIQVAAGTSHTCAILTTGSVRCWGRGAFGALGYGNTLTVGNDEVPSFVSVVDIGALASQIVTGASHTCSLGQSSEVTCWGLASSGQLGYGNINNIGDNELPSSAGFVTLR